MWRHKNEGDDRKILKKKTSKKELDNHTFFMTSGV